MAASTLLIKVKYGDFIRRFNARVVDDKLELSMDKLKEKICILFNLATNTELMLTYIDEDGEMVTAVDDYDLLDVVDQDLNPLRITVTMNEEKNSSPFICSAGSSFPLSSPRVQQQFQNINSDICETLDSIPNPLHEKLAKLSTDLLSNVSSSAPGVSPGTAEIIEYLSKVGLSCLSHISNSRPQVRVQPTAQNDIPDSKATVKETEDSVSSKVDPTPSKAQSQEQSKKQLSRNNDDSSILKSVTTMDVHKGEVEPPCPSFYAPFVANNVSTEEKVNKASGPHLGPNLAFAGAHDHVTCDPLDLRTKRKLPCNFGNPPNSHFVPYPGRSSNFPDSSFSPFHDYEGQLYGIPVENISAAQPQPASQAVSFGRNRSQNDFNGTMGKDNAYNRTDLPAIHPHQRLSKGLQFYGHGSLEEVNLDVSKLNSCFIVDVTMIDGTILAPLTPFTKIWRMRNNGTVVWPKKTRLVWIGGNMMSSTSVELKVPAAGFAVNQDFDVAVDFISPEVPGRYVSYWKMAAPSGQNFGQLVWVHIQVHSTTVETLLGVPGLSLNPPMVNNVLTGPKTNNAVMDSLVADSQQKLDMMFPIADSSTIGSGATNLAPIAPSSFLYPVIIKSDIASPVHPAPCVNYTSLPPPVIFPSTSPLLYPPPPPPLLYPPPPPPPPLLYPPPSHVFYPPPSPSPPPPALPPCLASRNAAQSTPFLYSWPPPAVGNTRENTEELQGIEVENTLLRELEEMEFKQVDLNKDILRFHEYVWNQRSENFVKVTTCGDHPIHEELQEME